MNSAATGFSQTMDRLVQSNAFRNTVILIIILAGVLVGLETSPRLLAKYGDILHLADRIILYIFIVEMAIRISAYGNRPHRFFCDPWNLFDFIIVAVCALPYDTEFAAVLRLARILRILRLITILPRLQFLVGALLKSIPSIGYIGVLLFLLFYIYACVGTYLFRGNDPLHFGDLVASMLTLFQIVTLEGWNEIMNIQIFGSHVWDMGEYPLTPTKPDGFPVVAPIYFISFILVGTMVILNLFIGVIMNGMAEMQAEHTAKELQEKRERETLTMADEIHFLVDQVDTIRNQLDAIRRRINVVIDDSNKQPNK